MKKSLIEDIKSKIDKKCKIIVVGGKGESSTTKTVFTNRYNEQIDVDCFEASKMPDTIEVTHQQKKRQICLTEEQFGDNIARTALMLKEALDTQNTKVMKDMINILIRDMREYSIHNFHGSNNPYSKMLKKLNMKHLLSLCESCIKEYNIENIVGNSKFPYFFDTSTCKQCGQKGDVYIGYRKDLDILGIKNES